MIKKVLSLSLFFTLVLFVQDVRAQLYINEVQTSNDSTLTDGNGEYDDWIEIYNAGNLTVNLAGHYLSDDINLPTKWQVPNTNASLTSIAPNSFLLIWADDQEVQGENHANFKLSSSGETVILSAPNLSLLDSLSIPHLQTDFSYARIPNGSAQLFLSSISSPLANNSAQYAMIQKPSISLSSGKYTGTQTVSISAIAGADIYYSLTGKDPDLTTTLYTAPFTIDSTTSLKAIAHIPGYAASAVVSKAYILNSSHTLPVYSVNINPEYLYSDTAGILVTGTGGDTPLAFCALFPANFWEEWEHPGNFILLDENGNESFNVDGGISVFGNCSRRYAKKSIALKTKSIYPSENIPFSIFPTRDQTEYRRLRIRSGGNHWQKTLFMDAMFHQQIENKIDIDVQSARPVVGYYNGVYQGISNLRPSYSKHYFRYKFPKYKDSEFDIIRRQLKHTKSYVVDGDTVDMNNLVSILDSSTAFTPQIIDSVRGMLDINNILNYYAVSMWVYTLDWPGSFSPSNIIYWKPKEPTGKWRVACLDYDVGMIPQYRDHDTYTFVNVPDPTKRNNEESIRLFRRLNQDLPGFNEEFTQRCFTYFNLLLSYDSIVPNIDNYANLINSEVPDNIALWGPQGGVPSYATWQNEIDSLKLFCQDRSTNLKAHIANYHNKSTIDISFNYTSATKGDVCVNSNFYRVPFNYSGEYLEDVDLWIHASPKPGYRFVEWLELTDPAMKYDASIYTSFSANQTLTPIFEPALDLVINEIHYDPSNDAEFIELYNPDDKPKSLYGYGFKEGIDFTFPKEATIDSGEYVIITNDSSAYVGNGYQVFQWECSKLDNGGEKLVLSNLSRVTIDSVDYDNENGWPAAPDYGLVSLGLKLPSIIDNSNEDNWAVQSVPATPGAVNEFDENHTPNALQINEIQYHTEDSINGALVIDDDEFEFIEIKNTNSIPLDISGYFFSRGISYRFPANTIIPANGFVVIAKDSLFFHARYGAAPDGEYEGKLSNSGEEIWLHNDQGYLIDVINYTDSSPWANDVDGSGYSLALLVDSLQNEQPSNWFSQKVKTTLWAENEFCDKIELSTHAIEICKVDGLVLSTLEQGNAIGGIWKLNNTQVNIAQGAGTFLYTFEEGLKCESKDSLEITLRIPDYSMSMAIAPSAIVGVQQIRSIISVTELNSEEDCEGIYVLVPKDISRHNFTYNSTATSMGGVSVENADWQYYTNNPSFHVWQFIGSSFGPLSMSTFGFIGTYNPNNTDGQTSFTAQVFGGSGGEENTLNNADSESLIYFK